MAPVTIQSIVDSISDAQNPMETGKAAFEGYILGLKSGMNAVDDTDEVIKAFSDAISLAVLNKIRSARNCVDSDLDPQNFTQF